MKGQRLLLGFVVMLIVLLVAVSGPAAARGATIECTGTEVRIAVLDPGVWTFPGGAMRVKGMVSQYQETSTCLELSGVNTVTMNAAWDANFVGPMWGNSFMETAYGGGGVWKGRWQGALSADGGCAYEAVLHGISGSVTGMKAVLAADCTTEPSPWTATLSDPFVD